MTLDKLIKRIKARKMGDADFEHPLALAIHEELEQCRENEFQEKLFNDARKLSDVLIEQYVLLDRENKLKMAEVYQQEEWFKSIGGLIGGTKFGLSKKIGKSNLDVLSHISNYSKIIPILERYIIYIEENKNNLNNQNSNLIYYLLNYNKEGKKVKRNSKESMGSFYQYDFKNNRQFKKGEKNHNSVLESMTYRIPEKLKQRVIDVHSLKNLRTKILENYLKYIEENENNLNRKKSSLTYYLTHHNRKKKVKTQSKESMRSFNQHDFKNNRNFKSGEKNHNSVLESMTYRIPEKLKQKVMGAQALTQLRTKILKNYLKYIEENEDNLKNQNSNLIYYLVWHNQEGKKVKHGSKESMHSFYQYDFENNRCFKLGETNPHSIFESMTYRIPEKLKQKVMGAQALTQLRTKILKNYLKYIEENEDNLKNQNSNLIYYLLNYNKEGKKVKHGSKESIHSFYQYDFENNRQFKKGEKNHNSVLESMTYRIPEKLKQKVMGAQALTQLRTKILKNYIKYVEKNKENLNNQNSNLIYYLLGHNKEGKKVKRNSKESMNSFYFNNFKNNRQFKKGETNTHSIFKSMTYRIKDQKLVEKVRRYTLE